MNVPKFLAALHTDEAQGVSIKTDSHLILASNAALPTAGAGAGAAVAAAGAGDLESELRCLHSAGNKKIGPSASVIVTEPEAEEGIAPERTGAGTYASPRKGSGFDCWLCTLDCERRIVVAALGGPEIGWIGSVEAAESSAED